MNGDLKVWSWMAPGLAAGCLFGLVLWLGSLGTATGGYCAASLAVVILVLVLQSVSGHRAFYRQVEVDQLSQKRTALADSAEVRLAEFMRGMHPETVRLFLKHRLEVWRIREMKGEELYTMVLDADPRINLKFLDYVMKNSNPFALMPKRLLSDKAHSFDPMGVVSDYEQYDALCKLMIGRGWVTEGHGGQPPMWIEPYNPELVSLRFGLALFEEEEPVKSEQ